MIVTAVIAIQFIEFKLNINVIIKQCVQTVLQLTIRHTYLIETEYLPSHRLTERDNSNLDFLCQNFTSI